MLQVREQVKYIFTDDPSHALWAELQLIFPALQILALDTVHLPFVYEYATWRKKTAGSRMLRTIVGKFNKISAEFNADSWGVPFTGMSERPLDREEDLARERILNSTMPQRRAAHVLNSLNGETPFLSRIEFIEALAALSAMHRDDMRRKVTGSNKFLSRVLWNAAAPSRIDWFLNNQRIRHALPHRQLPLLPVGTTSNESLHSELNAVFRQTQRLHQTTLSLKLKILTDRKQLAHNSALYHATTKQIRSSVVLAAVLLTPL